MVEQHDVGRLALDQRERRLAVARPGDAVAALAEPAQQRRADGVRVALGDEHEWCGELLAHPHW